MPAGAVEWTSAELDGRQRPALPGSRRNDPEVESRADRPIHARPAGRPTRVERWSHCPEDLWRSNAVRIEVSYMYDKCGARTCAAASARTFVHHTYRTYTRPLCAQRILCAHVRAQKVWCAERSRKCTKSMVRTRAWPPLQKQACTTFIVTCNLSTHKDASSGKRVGNNT